MLMLGKFIYPWNERVLALTFSGGISQHPEQNYFGNILLLQKYIGDILPTFKLELWYE